MAVYPPTHLRNAAPCASLSYCAAFKGEKGKVLNRGVRWHNGIHELQEASP